MTKILVSDNNLGPPVPSILKKIKEFGVFGKGVEIKELLKEMSNNPYDLLFVHCNALNRLEIKIPYLPKLDVSRRASEKIKDLLPSIIIVGYSPITTEGLRMKYGDVYDEYLSLSEDLWKGGLERVLRKHELIF